MSEPSPARPSAPKPQLEPVADTLHHGGSETSPDTGTVPGRIGEYVVIRKLGEGGMGAVFLARDEVLQRDVAIKTLKPELANNKPDRDRFLREARAAAQLTHDNVIPILHVRGDAGAPYMVMPFLPGEPLDERLKRDPVPDLEFLLQVAREVSDGLAAAHKKGLIHRDIKPGNIWLEGDLSAPDPAERFRRCKILDFGLARSLNTQDTQLTVAGAIMGTPAYMAPEQARGEVVDHRADLWSLGVMLYRMATGQLPFTGTNVTAVLIALSVDAPVPVRELNPTVPPPVADLIERLMCKDASGRPQSAAEVARAVRAIGGSSRASWGEFPGSGAAPAPVRVPPPGLEATTTALPRSPLSADTVTPDGATVTAAVPVSVPHVHPNRARLTELVSGFALVPLVALACTVPWVAFPGMRWDLLARVFALTTVLGWGLALVGRLPAPGGRIAPLHRAAYLLVGLGVGALAFWCGGWALAVADDAPAAEVMTLGAQRLNRDAYWAAVRYLLYFGISVCMCRWWLATDPARAWRVRAAPLAEAAVWGAVLLIVWPWGSAPLLLGAAVLVGAALAVQVVAPRGPLVGTDRGDEHGLLGGDQK